MHIWMLEHVGIIWFRAIHHVCFVVFCFHYNGMMSTFILIGVMKSDYCFAGWLKSCTLTK